MQKKFILCLILSVLFWSWFPTSFSLAAQSKTRPQQEPQTYTNSIGMEFVLVPAGSFARTFMVKNDAGEEQNKQNTFIVSKAFYLSKYQVTQEQWTKVMGNNPSSFKGKTNPVDTVSWDDAQEFIKRLNAKEKQQRYRLPTEAEWELAVRGGTDTPFFFLTDRQDWEKATNDLDAYAWFGHNSGGTTHPVGQKKPNPYGLHDMYGNVWEWMQDWYTEMPTTQEIRDYLGTAEDSLHVLRGGCWVCKVGMFRSGNRSSGPADKRNGHIGFRLAFSPESIR